MSQTFSGAPLSIQTTGKTKTTGASSANDTLPLDSAGNAPRYVRIAATVESYLKLGKDNTVAATANDILVQPADAVVLATNGMTYFAHIQGGTSGKLNVQALENV